MTKKKSASKKTKSQGSVSVILAGSEIRGLGDKGQLDSTPAIASCCSPAVALYGLLRHATFASDGFDLTVPALDPNDFEPRDRQLQPPDR